MDDAKTVESILNTLTPSARNVIVVLIEGLSHTVEVERARVAELEGELGTSRMEAINLRLELDEEKRARENVERCLRETQKLRLEDVARVAELESSRDGWHTKACEEARRVAVLQPQMVEAVADAYQKGQESNSDDRTHEHE